jgi:hypothetical protein
MDRDDGLNDRIDRLERQLARMKFVGSLLAVLACVLILSSLQSKPPGDGVLRARGLVIEDEAGRERILLGAPIPFAKNRVRTDPERVAKTWGPRFPKEYLDFYKGYRHDVNGLLVLDAAGFDRLALGDGVPDPNIGKRIGASTGLVINDEQGFERTGYGLLKVGDHYRANLGLDSANGGEGLSLCLFDEGGVGVVIADQEQRLFLGSAPPGFPLTGLSSALHGLVLLEGDKVKKVFNAVEDK